MKLPLPTLQGEFATSLEGSRKTVLRDALRTTVKSIPIASLDKELATFVPHDALAILASRGMRGEALFPTPIVLRAQPTLIGYYRLLFGYSQKQFYSRETGCSSFKIMEKKGLISTKVEDLLNDLCIEFATVGTQFLESIDVYLNNDSLLHELSLLTLGAQYRGAENNKRGAAGIKAVFEVIRNIVSDGIVSSGEDTIEIENAAKRRVSIALAADPDIFIISYLSSTRTRPIIAIEVKAGEDQSNIHNRAGEAEKSHLKAKNLGVTECWTIINVPRVDLDTLRRASPSTDRFYQLLDLTEADNPALLEFSELLRDLVGLG